MGGQGAVTTSGVYLSGTYSRTTSIGTGRRSAVSKQSRSSVKISPACSSILVPSDVTGDAEEAPTAAVSNEARTAAIAAAARNVAGWVVRRKGEDGDLFVMAANTSPPQLDDEFRLLQSTVTV
jgi:hypothetical protein